MEPKIAQRLRYARAGEGNVNAYVVKPVDFHDFVNAIKELGIFWAVINEPPPVVSG